METQAALRIALLGAESTGKTTLARELQAHFSSLVRTAIAVPEALRDWCVREGRTPRPEEQLPIAQEQERRVDEAASTAKVVIADTTAMMVAIYSAVLFDDHALVRYAVERQRRYDVTLVTGLDLPWVADGLQRDGPHVQGPIDAQVRAMLGRAGIPYRVVYGSGAERVRNALAAIDASLAPRQDIASWPNRSWVWQCDKCSDPDCEHRLFTRLSR
jgi:nicotinamide riboside kinase